MTLGIVLALASAFVWGSRDFCGGRAASRLDPVQVLGLAARSGIAMLALAALWLGEPLSLEGLPWAAVAGVGGALGIVALYRGLAAGRAATVAPVAAVTAAALPVIFAALTEGLPTVQQVAGFGLALAGIFLVARAAEGDASGRGGLLLGVVAGLGFGAFMVLIAQVQETAVFVPLAVARGVMLATAAVVLAARRLPWPRVGASPVALLAGVLDAGGNVLYLLARQYVRLDIAAVLSSLYPVATVLLAWLLVNERVSEMQWAGAAVCLVSVALIAA